jgi:hypothetical protein
VTESIFHSEIQPVQYVSSIHAIETQAIFVGELTRAVEIATCVRIIIGQIALDRNLQHEQATRFQDAINLGHCLAFIRNILEHLRTSDECFAAVGKLKVSQIHTPHGGSVEVDAQILGRQ